MLQQLEKMVFGETRLTQEKLERALANNPLLLSAQNEGQVLGFKFGYQIPDTATFFSWIGGVHRDFRRQGIAQSLLEHQERFAEILGLEKIYFTTFDRFQGMIALGLKNGYSLTHSELDEDETKFWYSKDLPGRVTKTGLLHNQ